MAKKISFNITDHILVPKHTVLNDKEKSNLFEKYNIGPSNLPRILKTDSVLVDVKVKEGDIIKVERKSPTAGKVEFYRLVVNE